MPLLHHGFRRFLYAFDKLNPAQIEDARTKIRDLRRKTEAISVMELRTNQEHECPFCGDNGLHDEGTEDDAGALKVAVPILSVIGRGGARALSASTEPQDRDG